MKKFFFLIAFCLPIFTHAQNNEGKIIYNEKTSLKIELPDDMKHHAKNLPSGAEAKMQLVFNENESLYKEAPKEAAAPEADEIDTGFKVKILGANQSCERGTHFVGLCLITYENCKNAICSRLKT